MAKKRNFSVYLLKKGFNATNSLKDKHKLSPLKEEGTNLPPGSSLFYSVFPNKEPWWKGYWGISQDIKTNSANALVFLPVQDRFFAVSFGSAYHNLKDEAYEYNFGLLCTLNCLDPEKIKSTDILSPETAKRERIQLPNATNLAVFDFNKDESILKRLTGSVKDEFKDLFKSVTGADSFHFSTPCKPDELTDLCSKLLTIYTSDEYKKNFPDILSISAVKDPALIEELNKSLEKDFSSKSIDLTLSIPAIIDYSTAFYIQYKAKRATSEKFEDVFIDDYRLFLEEKGLEGIPVSDLKAHSLNVYDEDERLLQSFSVFKSILYDCQLDGDTYHLCEGNWFKVNHNFIVRMKAELDKAFLEDHEILCECNKSREDECNNEAFEQSQPEKLVFCLDKKTISPKGYDAIEPCDLIVCENKTVELIHNKISTRSFSLSHLFNQGYVSMMMLRQNSEAKKIFLI